MPSQIQIQRANAKLKKRAMQKCKSKFNFPEAAVRKTERSQGEIETEFPQFFNTQDSKSPNSSKPKSSPKTTQQN